MAAKKRTFLAFERGFDPADSTDVPVTETPWLKFNPGIIDAAI